MMHNWRRRQNPAHAPLQIAFAAMDARSHRETISMIDPIDLTRPTGTPATVDGKHHGA
jgi:hypothetical protein